MNHIVNNDCFTTKLGLLNTLRDFFCRASNSSSSLSSKGMQPQPSVSSSSGTGTAATSRKGNKINFDDLLVQSSAGEGAARMPTPWLMETYQLDVPIDCAAVIKDDEDELAAMTNSSTSSSSSGPEGGLPRYPLWIYKPSCGNRGRGVHVVRGGRELKELVAQYVSHYHPALMTASVFSSIALPQASASSSAAAIGDSSAGEDSAAEETPFGRNPRAIIQKYVLNPLLVEGYKFDIRCYLLVARNDPTYLAFYHPGYCR